MLNELNLQWVWGICDSWSRHPVLLFCSEDEGVEVPVPQCRINFTFSGTSLKAHEALTAFALQTLDRVTRLKLSKDVSPWYMCLCVSAMCVWGGSDRFSGFSCFTLRTRDFLQYKGTEDEEATRVVCACTCLLCISVPVLWKTPKTNACYIQTYNMSPHLAYTESIATWLHSVSAL